MAGGTARGAYESSVPFRAGADGYASYRVPAVVAAPGGVLLAFAEGRVGSAADSGDIDVVLRRSADGGRTWSALQVVTENGTGTAGNPAPVVTDTGRVVLVHVRNAAEATEDRIMRGEVPAADGRRVWVQHSDDAGATWSDPREITKEVKRPEWRWYATGPGHATRLAYGGHAGRLVIPANHSLPPTGSDDGTEDKYYGGHGLLSDDRGETWRIGYVDDQPDGYVNANESTAAELPDGRLYLNTRNQNGSAPGHRADAHSADGGATLAVPFRPQAGLVAPVVAGSVLHLAPPAPADAAQDRTEPPGHARSRTEPPGAARVRAEPSAAYPDRGGAGATPDPAGDHRATRPPAGDRPSIRPRAGENPAGEPPAAPPPMGPGLLLFSGPADPSRRALMTLRASSDSGTTWRPVHTVDGLPAGYSDLVRIDPHTVGLLYETGDFSAYSTITFRRVPVEDLA
jgi:sialidase-1